MNINGIKKIYSRLGDDKSKEIFKNRLMYSITNDSRWLVENIKHVPEGRIFLETIDRCTAYGEIVIFGAGTRGKSLYQVFSKYPWKCFVDNYPDAAELEGIPLISGDKFFKDYQGEYIFLTPKFKNEVICQQLTREGIPVKKIINVGEIQNEIIKRQYFDLEYLEPTEEKEIFVDTGGYDGMTSVYFDKWSSGNGFSYIFEPDTSNIDKCVKNLANSRIKYQIISKGAWSEETTLHFEADADVSSKVSDSGDSMVSVTTIDKMLENEKVTFIKMDIEGSELQALIGAKRTIMTNTPKLAICIYHKPEDIWEIPNIILQYNPSYHLFLRHYTLTETDTVLYALP